MLRECLGKFLNSLKDDNLNVRRVALVTFNSAAHNKPILVRDLLLNHPNKIDSSQKSFIQHLYNETKVKLLF